MFVLDVVHALNHHKVDYALAGGVAVALHGAVRGTVDVDIVVAINEHNFMAVESTLQSLGLKARVPVTAKDVFSFRKEYIEKRNMIAWSFVNYANPGQVVDIVITHDLKKLKSKKIKLQGVSLPVLTVESLIEMKKAAGRPQDIEDIKALEALYEKSKANT